MSRSSYKICSTPQKNHITVRSSRVKSDGASLTGRRNAKESLIQYPFFLLHPDLSEPKAATSKSPAA